MLQRRRIRCMVYIVNIHLLIVCLVVSYWVWCIAMSAMRWVNKFNPSTNLELLVAADISVVPGNFLYEFDQHSFVQAICKVKVLWPIRWLPLSPTLKLVARQRSTTQVSAATKSSQGCFCSDCFAGVEHNSTEANYSLRICDVKICIAFTFAESMNQA